MSQLITFPAPTADWGKVIGFYLFNQPSPSDAWRRPKKIPRFLREIRCRQSNSRDACHTWPLWSQRRGRVPTWRRRPVGVRSIIE